jgi:hypothetical protein
MFFEYQGSMIPISQIKHCSTDGDFVTRITLLDGQVLASKGFYTAERLAAIAGTGCAGSCGILQNRGARRRDNHWIVGELELAEPITPEMVSEVQHYAVLCPDGRVYSPSGGKSYASRAEFINAMNSRYCSQSAAAAR